MPKSDVADKATDDVTYYKQKTFLVLSTACLVRMKPLIRFSSREDIYNMSSWLDLELVDPIRLSHWDLVPRGSAAGSSKGPAEPQAGVDG
jgi:hypothetical protein